jgi:adenosylcobinamide-GDP ribazoletransferase
VTTVRSAVALLTRFPVATADTDAPGAAAFGLVGAVVGVAGGIPLAVLAGPGHEPWLGAVAALAVMAVVTGALHLDGLADTGDALVARDPVAAERARKDPTLGVGGVLAIVLVVTAQVAALVSLAASVGGRRAAAVLIGVVVTSRVVPVLAAFAVARLSRSDSATLGSWFSERVATLDVIVAAASGVLMVTALAAVSGIVVAVAGIGAVVLGGLVAAAIVTLRRGLDGDGMGAIVELSVVAGLATAAVVVP